QITRKFYTAVRQIINSETLDFAIVGDKRRIMRIPYTLHVSTNKFCIPIDPSWSLDDVIKKAQKPDYSKDQVFNSATQIRKILIDYDEDEDKIKPQERKPILELKGARKE